MDYYQSRILCISILLSIASATVHATLGIPCNLTVISKGWYDGGATFINFFVNGTGGETELNGWTVVQVNPNCSYSKVAGGLS